MQRVWKGADVSDSSVLTECDRLRAELEKAQRKPEVSWTCFHCGETFTTVGSAADHFGESPDREPGCLIDRVALEEGGKPERGRGLLMALRKEEAYNRKLRAENEKLKAGAR